MPPPLSLLRAVCATACPLAGPLTAVAQAEPTVPGTGGEVPEALASFINSSERETRWSNNATPTATSARHTVKDVPVNSDAMTSNFRSDLGLFSAAEVTDFSANGHAAPVKENANQGGDTALVESPADLTKANLLIEFLDSKGRPDGARAAPWSASWMINYAFSRDSVRALRGVRFGANGSGRDNDLLGTPNDGQMIGGTGHLVNAYHMRDQKIWDRNVRFRADVKSIVPLETGKIRKSGFATMFSGANAYTDSCVMPPQHDLNVTLKF